MESNTINSWRLYEEWIELEDDIRQTWVIADETTQLFAEMGQGKRQEIPMRVTKHATWESDSDDTTVQEKFEGKTTGATERGKP